MEATSDFLMRCDPKEEGQESRLAIAGGWNVRVKIVDANIHDQVWSF